MTPAYTPVVSPGRCVGNGNGGEYSVPTADHVDVLVVHALSVDSQLADKRLRGIETNGEG